jgi:transposase
MKRFQGAMREQWMLMPYDLSEWLPETHLARFVVDITDKLDFSKVYCQYQGKGTVAYDPKLLLALLFYGYSTITSYFPAPLNPLSLLILHSSFASFAFCRL